MYIHRLSSVDLAGVVDLEQKSGSGWSRGAVEEELDRPSGLQLAAYEDSTCSVIGWCCGLCVGDEAELLRIAVIQCKRKCGVASALLAQFEIWCLEKEVSSIFLEVAEKNIAAGQLYEKFDYKRVGRRKDYYSHPEDDALVMNKVLL